MTRDTTIEYNRINSALLISLIIKWRKKIAIILLATLVASYIFTLPVFIKPKYKAKVVLYPPSTNTVSKALLSMNPAPATNLVDFGDEEKVEQMMQVLKSDNLKRLVISKFNLFKHYDIDSTKHPYPWTAIMNKFDDNVKFTRTEYMSVEIEVLDTDPQMAANIANGIAELYDSLQNAIQKERAYMGFKIVEEEYLKLQEEIKRNEDSLQKIRKKGVYDYEKQVERLCEQLGAAYVKDNEKAVKKIQQLLDTVAKYGGEYVRLRDQNIYNRDKLSILRTKYIEAEIDAKKYVPQKFLISKATKPEKKAYPIRWLIMLISVIAVFIITLITIIFIDANVIKKVKTTNQNITNPDNPVS